MTGLHIKNKIFGEYEFCYRSMNVQLQRKTGILQRLGLREFAGYYDENVYAKMVRQYDLKNVIPHGTEIAFEIYGSNIQKNYTYGCADGQHKIAVFGVLHDGKNVPFKIANYEAKEVMGLPYVPVLYVGDYKTEIVKACTDGMSVLDPNTKVREGCVVEAADGEHMYFGHPLLKSISDAYAMKDQTEYH